MNIRTAQKYKTSEHKTHIRNK